MRMAARSVDSTSSTSVAAGLVMADIQDILYVQKYLSISHAYSDVRDRDRRFRLRVPADPAGGSKDPEIGQVTN
jgi:hypothetical protein